MSILGSEEVLFTINKLIAIHFITFNMLTYNNNCLKYQLIGFANETTYFLYYHHSQVELGW